MITLIGAIITQRKRLKNRLMKERVSVLVLCIFTSVLWTIFYFSSNMTGDEFMKQKDLSHTMDVIDTVIPDANLMPE